MEQRILSYRKYIDELLKKENQEWQKIAEWHLVQIGFFQHERLIHLIVTVTFALLEMMSMCMTLISFSPFLGLLTILLLVLLIPYIRHYYILENEVQKMYGQYDRMMEHLGEHTFRKDKN
ncbi:MAG: hypothetical protein NC094_06915 [Bacteroidales bacterium]|nr:hypothetical protein [Lachnoclostridium sp.]MCM1384585.1 hypothetical protein [Lachnoclostridium sp.]MCM1465133.1 hypothetical protein [Bacteroidales bacterium]